MKILALEKIGVINTTLKIWRWYYDNSALGSELNLVALRKIEEMDLSLNEWFEIYHYESTGKKEGNDLETLAFRRMSEVDSTFAEWLKIYKEHAKSKVTELALEKMQEVESTFKDWKNIRDSYSDRHWHEAYILARKMMKKKASTLGEWFTAL